MRGTWRDRKTLFDALIELKKAGALIVKGDKYYATEEAIEVLQSFE